MMFKTAKKKNLATAKAKKSPRTGKFMSVKSKTLSDHLHSTTLAKYPWNSVKKSA